MNTYTLAHRFFNEPYLRGEYANTKTHFYTYEHGDVLGAYYSYSTCIAEIKLDKHGERVCVMSDYKYSTTTSKHLCELKNACPYDILFVPIVSHRAWYHHIDGMYDFKTDLNNVIKTTETELRQKQNREYVMHIIDMFDKYVARMNDMPADIKKLRKSKKIKSVIELTKKKNEELKIRQAAAASLSEEEKALRREKREAAVLRKFNEFTNGMSILDKLKTAYSIGRKRGYYSNDSLSDTLKKAIRDYRNLLEYTRDDQGRHQSYMWIVGDNVVTSQGVHVPKTEVERYCKIWASGHNVLGGKIGCYSIVENTSDHVKVGCHVIPVWNVKEMCNYFNIAV